MPEIVDVGKRRKEVYNAMPFMDNFQISRFLDIPESTVKRDIDYINKKISEERDKLVTRAHIEKGMSESYENYKSSEYPENLHWLTLYEKFVKDWLAFNKSANITFLQQNNLQVDNSTTYFETLTQALRGAVEGNND